MADPSELAVPSPRGFVTLGGAPLTIREQPDAEPIRAIQAPDGSYSLLNAPRYGLFTLAWLATTGSANVMVDRDGNLRLGALCYRPLHFCRDGAMPWGLLQLVCERIDPPT